jgi:hypothetical protein
MKLAFWRKRKVVEEKAEEFIIDEKNIVGVTMSWSARPCLCFKGGWILPYDIERMRFAHYYKNGDWPTHPETGEKLPIAK